MPPSCRRRSRCGMLGAWPRPVAPVARAAWAERAARPPQPPDLDGPVVDLDVERVAHGGVFVAHHEGRVVFVPDAIPGERVARRITDVGKTGSGAPRPSRCCEASPDRQRARLARGLRRRAAGASAPGGAEFGHIQIGASARAEGRGAARRARAHGRRRGRRRGARRSTRRSRPASRADGTGWRTRVRLHVDDDGRVGPYAARSHTVVPVGILPLAVPALAAPRAARRAIPRRAAADRPRRAQPRATRAIVVRRAASGCRAARARRSRSAWATAQFRLDRDGFWQVHRGAAATAHRAPCRTSSTPDLFDPRRREPRPLRRRRAARRRGRRPVRRDGADHDGRVRRAGDRARGREPRRLGRRARRDRARRPVPRRARRRGVRRRARAAPRRDGRARPAALRRRPGGRRPARRARARASSSTSPAIPSRSRATSGSSASAATSSPRLDAFDLFPNSHHVEAVARLTRYRVTVGIRGTRVSGEGPARAATVAIVDDHESVRLGLGPRAATPATRWSPRPSNVPDLLEALGGASCDVVVLDLSLGDGSTVTENVRAVLEPAAPCSSTASPTASPRCARRSPPAPPASSRRPRRCRR